jgi:hypothetical protein
MEVSPKVTGAVSVREVADKPPGGEPVRHFNDFEWKNSPDLLTEKLIIMIDTRGDTATDILHCELKPFEFLTGADSTKLLVKCVNLRTICSRIRLGLGTNISKPYTQYPSIADILSESVPSLHPMYKFAVNSYPAWKQYAPVLKEIPVSTMELLVKYDREFLNSSVALSCMGLLDYQPDIKFDSSGRLLKLAFGKKDYINMGLVDMERGFWKIYCGLLRKRFNLEDCRVHHWSIEVSQILDPAHAYSAVMHVTTARGTQGIRVVIPAYLNVLYALGALVKMLPSDYHVGGAPMSFGY